MTLFPIVGRELLQAARRPATHWTRFCAALATLTLWLALVMTTSQSVPVPQLSKNLLLGLAGLFPALWLAQEMIFRSNPAGDALLLPSPAYAFRLALDDAYRLRGGSVRFLVSLSLLLLLGLGCLMLAIVLLPRRWQAKEESAGAAEQPDSRVHIRRFREIASCPLSKEVKTKRAESTAAWSFGHRPLNSAQP